MLLQTAEEEGFVWCWMIYVTIYIESQYSGTKGKSYLGPDSSTNPHHSDVQIGRAEEKVRQSSLK